MEPEASISDIVFDPKNPRMLYAANRFAGVYRSTDDGIYWTVINHGLRMRTVNALCLSSNAQYLYAASEGEGVFRLDLQKQIP
jgi:hypothetical protein